MSFKPTENEKVLFQFPYVKEVSEIDKNGQNESKVVLEKNLVVTTKRVALIVNGENTFSRTEFDVKDINRVDTRFYHYESKEQMRLGFWKFLRIIGILLSFVLIGIPLLLIASKKLQEKPEETKKCNVEFQIYTNSLPNLVLKDSVDVSETINMKKRKKKNDAMNISVVKFKTKCDVVVALNLASNLGTAIFEAKNS